MFPHCAMKSRASLKYLVNDCRLMLTSTALDQKYKFLLNLAQKLKFSV